MMLTDTSVIALGEPMPTKTSTGHLLRASAKVFHERGFHAARVSDIAREAGVAQGTFYLYFSNKQEAFHRLLEHFAQRIRDTAAGLRWASHGSSRAPGAEVVDMCAEIFRICADNREVADLLFNKAGSVDARSEAVLDLLIRDSEDVVAAYLVEGAAREHFRPVKAETVARAIVGLILHTANRTIVGEGRATGHRELAKDLLDLELRGLLPRQGGGAR